MFYVFTFDASSCTGCKACQIACKDRNNLPVGVLWRRIYEVTGGTWTNVGTDGVRPGVWTTDVFAYNLSIACNHCVHPKCAGVCPTDAYVVREDGIVYIDGSRCMGCGYCAWACPYAAPKYDPGMHRMTKCNFCYDDLDAGLPPACVAACPMRVLNFATVDDGPMIVNDGLSSTVPGQETQPLWILSATNHPFPLPDNSRTEPHLAVKPHVGMLNGLEKTISNQEEVKPPGVKGARISRLGNFVVKGYNELPLVIFTLFGQMAAGLAFFWLFGGSLTNAMLVLLGLLIGVGGLVSLLHLGNPLNAWRSVGHLRKSWLSREVLMFGLFAASWLLCWIMPGMAKFPLALTGLGFIYCMAHVYRLHSIPAWDTWRTLVGFLVTSLLLGGALLSVCLAADEMLAVNNLYTAGSLVSSGWILLVLLCLELGLLLSDVSGARTMVSSLMIVVILAGIVFTVLLFFDVGTAFGWIQFSIFLLVLLESLLGRLKFFQAVNDRMM